MKIENAENSKKCLIIKAFQFRACQLLLRFDEDEWKIIDSELKRKSNLPAIAEDFNLKSSKICEMALELLSGNQYVTRLWMLADSSNKFLPNLKNAKMGHCTKKAASSLHKLLRICLSRLIK